MSMKLLGRPPATLMDKFWAKVRFSEGCWMWQAYLDKDGYGKLGVVCNGKWVTKRATHVAWFLATGAWPNACVLHTCDNPACVRFEHLFEGSTADNNVDCAMKGRTHNGYGLCAKPFCVHGHSLEANLYIDPTTGRRSCKLCRQDADRRRYVKNKDVEACESRPIH